MDRIVNKLSQADREALLEAAQGVIIIKLRKVIPNTVDIWAENGSVMLGFGDFVAEIDEREVAHVAGLE